MKKSILVSAAITGLISAACLAPLVAHADHHQGKCIGGNACSGKSECHSAKDKAGCKGKNKCKGKGWVHAASEEECKKLHGTWEAPKA